ncbi:site-2 protease family protein [bacterium]|nr:MAG: site-2 protease family protein [bacterium]
MNEFAQMLLWIPGLLMALTIHEYAHGRMAYELGDPTAARAGRLTLNPISHLDPVGTIALFLFHIGWAKPVPINPYFFRKPRRDMILVSVAGPGANFVLAIFAGLILKIFTKFGMAHGHALNIILYTMDINVILGMFNLIPVPPLDGSKILFSIANLRNSTVFLLERFGPMILLAIIVLGSLSRFNILWLFISPALILFRAIFL